MAMVVVTSVLGQNESRADTWSSMFESDSEFMKGFETGIYMRTRGGQKEEYGCAMPEGHEDNKLAAGIEQMRQALNAQKVMLQDVDHHIRDAVGLIEEFLGSLQFFFLLLGNQKENRPDMYCLGLNFGHQGSKMLVKFANLLIHPRDADGNVIPRDKRKDLSPLNAIFENMQNLARGFMGDNFDKRKTDEL